MSDLLVAPASPAADGTRLTVTPESAGWTYVGFEVLTLGEGIRARRDTGQRELCVVVISGTASIASDALSVDQLGGRSDPWSGPPDAVYLPPGCSLELTGDGEVALCWAPAPGGAAPARRLTSDGVEPERRGYGRQVRTVTPILMGDRPAESLLVCEVLTPGGGWSSYPPHKHDADDLPRESLLEETYYHRISPGQGFGLQRVYTADGSLDETLSFRDGDCVLVPRGYHTVSAPPGYELYYLNVMAGPRREWAVANDPDHEWRLTPPASEQRRTR
jgi:5-deoxy-glucuronate isomerase